MKRWRPSRSSFQNCRKSTTRILATIKRRFPTAIMTMQ
nr:MAG TPA: hypothetical protein [Caudoviricetes sp.]DAR54841.1 MAG TPA: hypothetical protein [Caudoviricetes sp.]